MERKQNNIERNKARKSFNKGVIGILLLSILTLFLSMPRVMAHCPLCTAATIIGVGVTRSFGWDDAIVGIFVGAMVVSSALWVNNILKKKGVGGNGLLRISSLTVASFVLTILTFYLAGLFGLANTYRIFGMEKILFGTLSGGVVTFAAFFASNVIKSRNNGMPAFSYQTMIITFAAILVNAALFWVVFQ